MKRQMPSSTTSVGLTTADPNTGEQKRRSYDDNLIRELRLQANQLRRQLHYNAAISKYTKLIDLCPDDETYGHRATCYMMQKNYEKAFEDAKKSVEENPDFGKGHRQLIQCGILLYEICDVNSSVEALREILDANRLSLEEIALSSEVLQYHSQKMSKLDEYLRCEAEAAAAEDYITVLSYIEKTMRICPYSRTLELKKAECLIELNRLNEAAHIAKNVLRRNSMEPEAYYVLGRCLYHTDIRESIQHLEKYFTLNPDSNKGRELYSIATRRRRYDNLSDTELKEEADQLCSSGNYNEAIAKYTTLIEFWPSEDLYGGRAACYMLQGDYERAVADARTSVTLNPQYIEGHCQLIRYAFALHDFSDINSSVEKVRAIDPTNAILGYHRTTLDQLNEYLSNEVLAVDIKNYISALWFLEKAMKICPLYLGFKVKKAEHLIKLSRFAESEMIAHEILKKDKGNADAYWVLGMCLYQRDIEQSIKYFEESFKLCPNSKKNLAYYRDAKLYIKRKAAGNDAYKSQKFLRAYRLYHKALKIDPTSRIMQGTLYFNIAQASYKLEKLDRCIKACGKTLTYNPDHVKARVRRAQCYTDRKQYAEAVEDLQRASKIDSSTEIMKRLREAMRLLEEVRESDWYWILGVSRNASRREIEKAYKKLTLLHHPDRHTTATDEEKQFHEQKCKNITRAYRTLMEQMS